MYGAVEQPVCCSNPHKLSEFSFLCTLHEDECQDKRHVSFTLHMETGQNDIHEIQHCTPLCPLTLTDSSPST